MNIIKWHKSTRSGSQSDCVEQGQTPDGRLVGVRDSKNPGPMLVFTTDEWRGFIQGVKAGEFDL